MKTEDKAEEIVSKLNEAFLPQNLECDGGACVGCWKDVVREAIKMIERYASTKGGWTDEDNENTFKAGYLEGLSPKPKTYDEWITNYKKSKQ